MRVLILGGSGMLGHKAYKVFAARFDTYTSVRKPFEFYSMYNIFDRRHTIESVSVGDMESVMRAIWYSRPDAIVNCIGVVPQVPAGNAPCIAIKVNALFPNQLAFWCQSMGIRVIHISSDCVFSGKSGGYIETDDSDADTLYGKTKFLGEPVGDGCLTLRTSMIGHELATKHGLLEWYLNSNERTVSGYDRAIFSGLTTTALSETIALVLLEYPDMQGVWHVAGEPISKFDLLTLVQKVYGYGPALEPDSSVVCDRSLCDARFREATGSTPPNWQDAIEQMCLEETYACLKAAE